MKALSCICGLLVVYTSVSLTCADLTPVGHATGAVASLVRRGADAPHVGGEDVLAAQAWPTFDSALPFVAPLANVSGSLNADHRGAAVRGLPPEPDSATLFLFGLGSLGAWQLTRSARKFHLGAIPDWYHAGGPAQVGHAKPIDLDAPALHLCCFEQPTAEPPTACRRGWRPRARACRVQHFLTIGAPRAPPLSP